MRKNALSTLIAVSAGLTLLSGCGMTPGTGVSTATGDVGFDAAATKTLKEGFKNVHLAIFTKFDNNGDKYIDEYEAGPYFNLTREFPNADKGKSGKGNGKISKTEFMKYATAGGLLSGRDNPNAFMDRMRRFIATAFGRLDKKAPGTGLFGKGDGYLSQEELSDTALAKLGLGFAYDKVHVRVMISAFDPADVTAADKTGDGQLSQGEFEDLYMGAVAKAINPNYVPGPAPAPAPAPADPVAPPADPGTGGNTPVVPAESMWWNF